MTLDEKVLASFYEIITENKQEMFDRIAAERTNHVTVVMENIHQEHNASAVLRTCDCFGIQSLHAIEKNNTYEIQRDIALGAGNWVDLYTHSDGTNPTTTCLNELKAKGYTIVATSPHVSLDINDLNLEQPVALVFGTEKKGVSSTVEDMADELVHIPMYGFTESFNISVSAAIALNIIRRNLKHSSIDWKLSYEEQIKLKIQWCTKIIREGEIVENEIRRRHFEKE